jgi:hypothetical protein
MISNAAMILSLVVLLNTWKITFFVLSVHSYGGLMQVSRATMNVFWTVFISP